MFAVMVLLASGRSLESALADVHAAGSSPETAEQDALVKKIAFRFSV
jgi:hypothetical protein